ncbi:hypothetical protein [Pseudomonas asplenii]|uniref:hypothetical protein n=1 Tax=Pseudomonas asplenii TaxID=53407 RepID=UPI001ED8ECB8|nr:hypothetical protein [Pseudomonas fuscovaginae]
MSPLQQAGDTPQYAIVLTPLVWKKAVKGYKNKRGSTFESRLRERASGNGQSPQATPASAAGSFRPVPASGETVPFEAGTQPGEPHPRATVPAPFAQGRIERVTLGIAPRQTTLKPDAVGLFSANPTHPDPVSLQQRSG